MQGLVEPILCLLDNPQSACENASNNSVGLPKKNLQWSTQERLSLNSNIELAQQFTRVHSLIEANICIKSLLHTFNDLSMSLSGSMTYLEGDNILLIYKFVSMIYKLGKKIDKIPAFKYI